MEIEQLIANKVKLDELYQIYLNKKLILKSKDSNLLKKAHIEKAIHNLNFAEKIMEFNDYNDWRVVTLYYTLYHSFLALVENKGYSSKNHIATVVFVLKHYIEFDQQELELFNNLKISEEDAIFYSKLKSDRNKASYSTNTNFEDQDINELNKKVKKLINKIKHIITNE
ncbi:MAG: HEPN domain-containing protein [Bacteroidales bacterium]|jgi:uncharacterized protein (UPF0332 family)|nr:HEPN domain-containing protein [Bacteroidales bacterium]